MKKIEDLTYNYDPNFTVIVPGGCNAHCSFCFWKEEFQCENYLQVLEDTIMQLPEQFRTVSISGGEPTLNTNLKKIIGILKKRFNKIVLTTNGAELLKFIEDCQGVDLPTHVNISRHGINWSATNYIFKVDSVTDDTVMRCNNLLNALNISSTMNVVCTDLPQHNYSNYISYAKSLDFNRLCFRIDHRNGKYLNGFTFLPSYQSQNPVSKCDGYLIKGMNVEVRSSALEAVDIVDYCHELVFHPSGKLSLDWKGEHEIDMNKNVLAVNNSNDKEDVLKIILNEINNISKRLDKIENTVVDDSDDDDIYPRTFNELLEDRMVQMNRMSGYSGTSHGGVIDNPRSGHGGNSGGHGSGSYSGSSHGGGH